MGRPLVPGPGRGWDPGSWSEDQRITPAAAACIRTLPGNSMNRQPENILVDCAARPVIAHRGASARAPENTIPAFAEARESGAEAFELDVHLSADGVPVVIHDADLARTTGRAGLVEALPFSALLGRDAGHEFSRDGGLTFPWRDRGVLVPSLGQVLEAFPGFPLLIELKSLAVAGPVAALLLDRGAASRVVVASESHPALKEFRQAPFLAGASRRDIAALYFRPPGWPGPRSPRYRALAVPDRFGPLTVPSARFLARARRLGCPVHVWTVNDPIQARRFWAAGAAGMVTDDPATMLEARRGLP